MSTFLTLIRREFYTKSTMHLLMFFVWTAFLGYAAIIKGNYLYMDDYVRLLLHHSCGKITTLRSGNFLFEHLMFLSSINMDATPFTQIISCLLLAIIAMIWMKLFCTKSTIFSKIVFASLITSPYFLESMSFRFDNIFFFIALFLISIAVYVRMRCDSYLLPSIFIFASTLFYQAALSAYFIAAIFDILKTIAYRDNLISKIKMWMLPLFSLVFLIPLILLGKDLERAAYFKFIIPTSLENLKIYWAKICLYYQSTCDYWENNFVGTLYLCMLICFIVSVIMQTIQNKKQIIHKLILSIILLVILSIIPMGVSLCIQYGDGMLTAEPIRVLYTMPILITLVYHFSYQYWINNRIILLFHKITICILWSWNIIFANIYGNLLVRKTYMINCIAHNMANDIRSLPNFQQYKYWICAPVNNIEKRLNEAAAAGFKKAIIPYANDIPNDLKKIETVKVKRLMDAIAACVSAQ